MQIDFEHGCRTEKCLSHLTLTEVSKYSGQLIEKNLIKVLPTDVIELENVSYFLKFNL